MLLQCSWVKSLKWWCYQSINDYRRSCLASLGGGNVLHVVQDIVTMENLGLPLQNIVFCFNKFKANFTEKGNNYLQVPINFDDEDLKINLTINFLYQGKHCTMEEFTKHY